MVRRVPKLSRQFLAALTALLLVLFWVPGLIATPASAANPPTLPASGPGAFDAADGDMAAPTATPLDWESPSVSGSSTNFSPGDDSHQSCGSDDNIFSSTKEDDTVVTAVCQSSPGKVDLTRVYAYSQTVSNQTYLYLAWEAPNQSGGNDNHIDFELDQHPQPNLDPSGSNVQPAQAGVYQLDRIAGDLLFDYDLTPGNPTVTYSTWVTGANATCDVQQVSPPCWGPRQSVSGSDAIAAIGGNFTDHIANAAIGSGGFGEMGIDLTSAGIFTATKCTDFTSFWAKGRASGSGPESEMKDYVPPASLSVSNCDPLSILKEGPNGEKLAGAHFSITPADASTPAVPSGQSPCVTQSDGYCYVKISSNPDKYAKPLLFPGNYSVQETQAPDGYFKASPDTQPVTVPQPSTSPDLTFTDGLGSVTFYKVDGDIRDKNGDPIRLAGATFRITATGGAAKTTFAYDELVTDGGSASADGTHVKDDSSTPGTITVSNLPVGNYQITETTPPSNWYTTDGSTKTFSIDDGTFTQENPTISSAFVDSHVRSTLIVEKSTADGDKAGAHFTLYDGDPNSGGTPVAPSCITGDGTVTDANNATVAGECSVGGLDWGHTYFWKETQAPPGYNLPDTTVLPKNGILIPAPGGSYTSLPTSFPVTDFVDTTTAITTAATQDGVAGTTAISDSASLTGVRQNAVGTITFSAYANDSGCSTTPEYTHTVNVSGPNTYSSGSFTPRYAGTYYWLVTYSGDKDANNVVLDVAATDTCGNMSNGNVERSPVTKHALSLSTVAADTNSVDGFISDTATFADLIAAPGNTPPYVTPNGTVTFTLYGACGGTERGHVTVPVVWNAKIGAYAASSGTVADSGSFQADNTHAGGLYYWSASYNPGTNDNYSSFTESCGGTNETSHAPVLDTPLKTNNPTGSVSIFKNDNQIAYTITVHNSGAAEMDGVTVTDAVSALAIYNAKSIGCDSFALSCNTDDSAPATNLTWTFNLAAGATASLTFSVTVDPGDHFTVPNNPTYPPISNHAHVTNGNTGKDTNTVSNPVDYPILSINKCAVPEPQSITAGTNGSCTTDPTGFVAPNSTIGYSLTLHNAGDQDASGVTVSDAIPPGTSLKPNTAACDQGDALCSVQVGTVNNQPALLWSGVTVGAGKDVVLTFSVQVASSGLSNGQKIDNTASFAWSNSGSTPPDESGTSATVEHVVKFPVITGTKDANPLPTGDPIPGTNPQQFADGIVHPGDVITYTLGAQNAGLASKAITITDDVPGGTTYKTGSASCGTAQNCTVSTATSNNVTTVTWHLTLPPGTQGANTVVPSTAQVTFSVIVTDSHSNGDVISNFATVDGVTTRTVTHEVTFPIISAMKSSDPVSGTSTSPTLVGPGTKITYTVSVSNAGLQSKAVTVSDQVPAGTTYNNDASCGSAPNCTVSTSTNGSGVTTVTWTLTVPAGTGSAPNITPTVEQLTFSVTTPDVQSKLIDNTATFTNDHTPNCTDPTCSTDTTHHEVVFPVITADKSADPAAGASAANATAVSPGQVITYTLNVHNTGEADASGVAVTDAIPTGTSYVAGSADNGGSYDATSNQLSWSINVAKHTSVALTFKVTVLAGDANGTIIPNTASYAQVHNPTPSGCTNGTCSTNTTYHEVKFPVLALSKSADPASGSIVQRGDTITYTLALVNSGLAAGPAVVTDTLPDNVTLVDGSESPAPASVNGKTLTWNVTVPAGGTSAVTYKVTVDQDAPEGSTQTNVALVGGQCVGNADPGACTTQHHVPTGALTLVKAVDKTTANYGDTLTYRFTAATTGTINQTAVSVTDVLPNGTSYVAGSASCSDAAPCTTSYNAATKTVTWQLGDMAAGASRHLIFKVKINEPNFDVQTGLPPLTIDNVGAIVSGESVSTPSNHVITKVVAVLGVKIVRKPRKLPFTGMPTQEATAIAMLMIGAGVVLTRVRRRREQ